MLKWFLRDTTLNKLSCLHQNLHIIDYQKAQYYSDKYSDVFHGTWKHHPARPDWAASQPRCVISTDKLTFYKAVPSPVLSPCLDDVWKRPLARSFSFTDENAPSLKSHLVWFESGWEWSLQRATCLSSGWLWRCSSSSFALLRVRLQLCVQAARR